MLKTCERGGKRFNISVLPDEVVDISFKVQEIVNDILEKALHFVEDRVEFSFHKTKVVKTNNDVVVNSNFYTLDKLLTQQEIEAINKWLIDAASVFDTPIVNLCEIAANHILREMNKILDEEGVKKVIVHFSPGDSIIWYETYGALAYGVIDSSTNSLEIETSFYVEGIYD